MAKRTSQFGIYWNYICGSVKVYCSLSLELLIAKVEMNGLDKTSKTVGSSYSHWSEINGGVLQVCILEVLLLNIFTNELFCVIEQSNIFADNNIVHILMEQI